ncbi:MAG: ATP-binding protein [Methanobacteriaceae archaeon]|jgi:nucleolar protein 56|nr:ATP-binding protein [Methanobacteriaceae archaeon]
MNCYITYCVAGIIAIDESQNIVNYRLFDEPERLEKLQEIADKKITEEEINLIEKIHEKYDLISIESQSKKSNYNKWNNVTLEIPNKGGKYLRNNLEKILNEINYEYPKKFTKSYRELASYKVKNELNTEDKYLIQSINSIDDIDESINKLVERMRDWYSLYFPELDSITSNEKYIKLIAENKDKKDIIENNHITDDFIDLEDTINPENIAILNDFAKSIYSLQKTRKKTEEYINKKMKSLAPNLTNLVGHSLGAKLISHAGGLEKLASYPSGTIQIMGAEKALFRHLKTGADPPKHGLIFQHPKVRNSKWWNRGKIAKKLSLKISLSIRKDVYSKEFDSEINNKFLKEVKKIEKDNPFAKRKSNKTSKKKKRKGLK